MKIISNKKKLIKIIHNEKNLGFVPTMGAIHKGHISLIKKSISQCNKTVVSIFVNKPQFNRTIDYRKYPRLQKKDIKILKRFKIDIVYIPTSKQIYPNRPNKKIKINSFENNLCGKFRPGHFRAVVDVIERFIKIINPKRIYLGEKDMQQLKILEDFINKKYKKIKVIGCKTVREKNGVPYSSRNFLLSLNEKKIASKVYKIMIDEKNKLISNKRSISSIKNKILELGVNKIEYLKIININKILKPFKKNNNKKLFIAYYLRNTRIIDNV
tara:strand:+ start:8215 stop:9024 length:810 start_codon:yes stop_codon:yes gene_type:complete